MTTLYHDIETRSTVNLPTAGAYAYAESKTTEVIVMSWAIDDAPVQRYYPIWNEPIPTELRDAFLDPAVTICAHNAGFESVVEGLCPLRPQKFLPPEIVKAIRPKSRWNCTAARSAAVGLPRALEKVARALRLPFQKDPDGHRLMMKMCRPRALDADSKPVWWEDRDDVLRLGQYCDSDVEPERVLDRALPALSAFERHLWEVTEEMNSRGILVDQKLLGQMIPFVGQAESELNGRLRDATCPFRQTGDRRSCLDPSQCKMKCGCVPKASDHMALRRWLVDQGYEDVEETGVGKDVIAGMLEAFAEREASGFGHNSGESPLSDDERLVRDVLLLRREGGKSSTAKYRAILSRLNADGRIRGVLMYCGAAATGRYSSSGAQLQNMPRTKQVKDLIGAVEDIRNGMEPAGIEVFHGSPLVVSSEALRPSFVAPEGYWLARGDFSQIESRVIAWFAGFGEKLNAFRKYDTIVGLDEKGKPLRAGPDIYRTGAARIYGSDPLQLSDEERQVGKVSELACGYQGSVAALRAMCKLYNVSMTDEMMAWVVGAWREANPLIVQFWRDLEDAAFRCVRRAPGERFYVGNRKDVWFSRTRIAMGLRMPSGRSIVFWYVHIAKQNFPWGERDAIIAWHEDGKTKMWCKGSFYGGIFAAMITQGFARELMAYSLVDLADEGHRPVLTVHDEGLCEMAKELYPEASQAAEAVKAIMLRERPFARGLPVSVDGSAGLRYFK